MNEVAEPTSQKYVSWRLITERRTADSVGYYLGARCAGLDVTHYTYDGVRDFDSTGGELGMFREIGSLIFYKDERRWEVRAYPDCSAVDLSTLIACGLNHVRRFGGYPSYWTRNKWFRHLVSKRTGKRIATARVCYRLEPEDLVASVAATEELPLDVSSVEQYLASVTA